METIIVPTKITKENFLEFGEVISVEKVTPININDGYAQRYDNLANINTSKNEGKTIVSIFSSIKRSFPMKIDMMEKHPFGSQAFMPMKETTFLCFVAPQGEAPDINKIKSFVIPPKIGINYKPGIWHFPLITTEDTDFLVIDRHGSGKNLIIHKFEKEKIVLKF